MIPIFRVMPSAKELYFVSRVYLATLDSLEHLLCQAVEAHVYVLVGLCRGLDVEQTVGGGEAFCLLFRDLSLRIEVGFVAHEDQHKILAGARARFRDEAAQLLK